MGRQRYDPGRDRGQLNGYLKELSAIVAAFCAHEPVLRGSVQKLKRRCGKPRCRCRQGALHESWVIVERTGTTRRVRKVEGALRRRLAKPAAHYRRLRRLRARAGVLHQEMLACFDRLRQWRSEQGRRLLSRLEDP